MKKIWHVYTMKLYCAVKKKVIMKFSRKWMELENFTLYKRMQTQKDKHHIKPIILNLN